MSALSLRLTARSFQAIRASDALSARVNQILDRYLLMTEASTDYLGENFLPAQWHELQRALKFCSARGQSAQDQARAFVSGITDAQLRARIGAFGFAQMFALFDALEIDD